MTGAWLTAKSCCKEHNYIRSRCDGDEEKARAKLVELECLNLRKCTVCKNKIPETRNIRSITCNDLHSKIWNKSKGDSLEIARLLTMYSENAKPTCRICSKPTKAFGRLTCGDDECARKLQMQKMEIKRRKAGVRPRDARCDGGACAYPGCNGTLKGRSLDAKFCSRECAQKASNDRRPKRKDNLEMRECVVCHKGYEPKRVSQRTCGDKECRVTFNGAKQNVEVARRRYLNRREGETVQ